MDTMTTTNDTLSAREREILRHIVRGESNKQIAYALGISLQTVKNHLYNMYQKLGIQCRTQAAIYAYVQGWL